MGRQIKNPKIFSEVHDLWRWYSIKTKSIELSKNNEEYQNGDIYHRGLIFSLGIYLWDKMLYFLH